MIRAIALALIAALAACAAPTPRPQVAPRGTLELFDNRLYLPATVNGSAARALLDSGAELSVLDDDFAARLGLPLTGQATAHGSGAAAMQARFARDATIAAAGVRLPGRTVAVLDLGEVSARLIGRPIDMILGRDLFDAGRMRIVVQAGRIAMVARDAEPAGVRLALTGARGIETFPVRVEGHGSVPAVFDLGNGSEVLVGRAFARRTGIANPDRIVERRAGGGLGGSVERDIVLLRSVLIAGVPFRNVPAAIDDSPSAADLNIGTQLLRRFLITTDFPQRAIWLEPR